MTESRCASWRQSLRVAIVLALAVFAQRVHATPAFEAPALRGHVNDYAQLLASGPAEQLEARLTAFEAKTGHQYSLLTIPTLNGIPIEEYAIKVAEAWKLGSKKNDDGLIMLIATADHQMRVEVGYGLEGVVPDAIAARVVREVLQPAFRAGDFAYGIEAGFDTLIQVAGGDGQAQPVRAQQRRRAAPGASFSLLVPILLFIAFSVLTGRRRRSYWGPTGFGGGGFGGFGGGGFGGGGGGGGGFSGGGGGFGGGGASGSW